MDSRPASPVSLHAPRLLQRKKDQIGVASHAFGMAGRGKSDTSDHACQERRRSRCRSEIDSCLGHDEVSVYSVHLEHCTKIAHLVMSTPVINVPFDIMASQAPVNAQNAASVEELQTAFDHSIWYLLSLWQPLNIALQNGWGGPDSADKRDWFAGAVSDLLTTRPDTDQEDLEEFLLQIMGDEFECNVEDESEIVVAGDILKVRQRMMETRTLDAAKEVEGRWKNRGSMKSDTIVVQEVNQDADEEAEFEEFEDDEEMDEAPALVQGAQKPPKEKTIPEVDDDGFTKVAGKKRTG